MDKFMQINCALLKKVKFEIQFLNLKNVMNSWCIFGKKI